VQHPQPPRHRTLVALACLLSASVSAHHYIGNVYDSSKPKTLEGTVAAVRFQPPHPFVEIDVIDPENRAQRWRLELDNHFELVAVGMTADTLRSGDTVRVRGSSARNGDRALYVRSLERPSDGFLYQQVGSSPRIRLPK
jgi:hypothetical protein